MSGSARHRSAYWIGLALALCSSAAMALGLGEIRVKSQPGQPLLAEIPVISNEPGELEQLSARLASPVTFERVGLPRPQGLVNELDFAVALDDAGRPIIRVTSRVPVDVAAVNFLIEVDWGQGRLVREYSALVSTPGTLAAAGQPPIDAPVAAPSDLIVRTPESPVTELPPEPAVLEAPPQPVAVATVPQAPAAPVAPTPSFDADSAMAPVRRGQTLSQIAAPLAAQQGYTLDQTMVALLRANPEAFINGNINLLKQGAVLRLPQPTEVAQLQEAEAAALVRSQIAEWRQARRPIPQPAAVADTVQRPTSTSSAPQVGEARLEIAPPAASAANTPGTQSGISAGGEGDMLANEQLQQTREDLAARESELQELRAQVAELEKLKQQQEQLLAMKDSDLAAAQQRLAQSQGDAGVPVWMWAGLGLLLIGALAWGWSQRRKRVMPVVTSRAPIFDSAALAAAMPTATAAAPVQEPDVQEDLYEATETAVTPAVEETPAFAHKSVQSTAKPAWHSGDSATTVAPLNPAPAGRERLELAVAYLDLGDVATARDLLNEVAVGGDDRARDEALQLLREIG
ncbi:FimV/HubP family polar landmark protein [Pseudoxanthomonas sp. UTMC 1351]|uniref:FimV/HubP family polar landmark protein n=1 Tax=Pseudoxanthomonas sp. UTMC 1351 TaxID=2695853 RepID=UPI0034CD9512